MHLDYNSLAREYALHRQVMPEVLQNLLDTGGLSAASQVLDVGCGTGNYTLALENALGCSCCGVDPSRQMLACARERPHSAHFQLGKAEQLDFPSTFFDLVFSVDVIHHVSDLPAYFREAFRVLKEGGRVCTVTDSEEIIRRRQPLSVYFPETIPVEMERYPRIADLRTMMLASGFDSLQETLSEHAYELTDMEPYRNKAFSSLHLIPAEAFEHGMQRMQRDLQDRPIPAVSRYVLLWGAKPSG
jgi:ubiquinone/menaquinone biosynthesis C-methylase UbiE